MKWFGITGWKKWKIGAFCGLIYGMIALGSLLIESYFNNLQSSSGSMIVISPPTIDPGMLISAPLVPFIAITNFFLSSVFPQDGMHPVITQNEGTLIIFSEFLLYGAIIGAVIGAVLGYLYDQIVTHLHRSSNK